MSRFQDFLEGAGEKLYVDYLQHVLNDLDKKTIFSASAFEIWSVALWRANYDRVSLKYVPEPTAQEIQKNGELGFNESDKGEMGQKCLDSVHEVVLWIGQEAATDPSEYRSRSCEDQIGSMILRGWESGGILSHLLPAETSLEAASNHFLINKGWREETVHHEILWSFYLAVSYRLLFSAHESRSTRKMLGLKKGLFG